MSNCKFLRQKKQVQINGEWVDTRSYRYLPYCDGGTPSVTIKGEPKILYYIYYYNINNPSTEHAETIRLDSSGNGYIKWESDNIIFRIDPGPETSTFEAEIKGCNVSGFGGLKLRTLTVSNSTYYRPNLDRAFNNCPDLSNIIFKGFDTSKATTMYSMFDGCRGLTSLDLSNFNTSNVYSMSYMFVNCSKLTSLDISNFDTSKVTDMTAMFNSCSSLTTIYVGANWNTTNVTSSESMFYGCTKLPNYNASVADKTNAHTGAGGYLT